MPANEALFFAEADVVFDAIWQLLLIAAVICLTGDWESLIVARPVWERLAITGLFVICLCVAISEKSSIANLVHIATAGIDAALPLQHQRVDAFPNHVAEGFSTYWRSVGAVVSLFLSAAAAIALLHSRGHWLKWGFLLVVAVVGLSVSSVYVCWFATREFARLSPDLHSAGPAAERFDLYLGGSAGALVCLLLAIQHSRYNSGYQLELIVRGKTLGVLPYYLIAGALLATGVLALAETAVMLWSWVDPFGLGYDWTDLLVSFAYMATDPMSLLVLALLLAGLKTTEHLRRPGMIDVASIEPRLSSYCFSKGS